MISQVYITNQDKNSTQLLNGQNKQKNEVQENTNSNNLVCCVQHNKYRGIEVIADYGTQTPYMSYSIEDIENGH